jgi:hypothetical protein
MSRSFSYEEFALCPVLEGTAQGTDAKDGVSLPVANPNTIGQPLLFEHIDDGMGVLELRRDTYYFRISTDCF